MEGHYVLNLIDTPGHVDFSYEVSRSLEACEGAVLLVDAAQGIEAQTLATLTCARRGPPHHPGPNKIDLPAAQPDSRRGDRRIIGCDPFEALRVSGKTGEGVIELLDNIVRPSRRPSATPTGRPAR